MIKVINEIRKEDDHCFCGPFWIIAESVSDIYEGKFKLESVKYLCDYNGNILDDIKSKSQKTHRSEWNHIKSKYGNENYTYYPRGRVAIHNGKAYVHLHSMCNLPKVIGAVIEEYGIQKLDISVDLNDTYQGSHYDFELN